MSKVFKPEPSKERDVIVYTVTTEFAMPRRGGKLNHFELAELAAKTVPNEALSINIDVRSVKDTIIEEW